MRKLLLIGALVLIAAVAFAQNAPAPAPTLVFTGALYTGTIAQSFNGGTPSLGIWDPINQTLSRFNFQGTYNGDGFGLNFRLREDDNFWDQGNSAVKITGISIPNAPGFRRLYGWIDAASGMIRVAAGRLAGYEWATGDAGGFNTLGNLDGAVGMQLQIKPIDGLNVGAFLPFTYGTSGSPVTSMDLVSAVNFMAFGVKYTMKGVFDIEGGYWLAPDNASTKTTNSSSFYQFPKAWFGAEYIGTPNLTAILETQFANSTISNNNYAYLAETIAYKQDQLGLALYAEQQLNSNSNWGMYFGVRPTIDYTIGIADVGVFGEVLYVTSNNFFITNAAYSGNLGYSGGPFVKLTFAKNVYIRLQGEVGGGSVTPPSPEAPFASYPGNLGSPGYQGANGEGIGFSPLSGTFYQANLNFVVSF
jgi:hypothetical protein